MSQFDNVSVLKKPMCILTVKCLAVLWYLLITVVRTVNEQLLTSLKSPSDAGFAYFIRNA